MTITYTSGPPKIIIGPHVFILGSATTVDDDLAARLLKRTDVTFTAHNAEKPIPADNTAVPLTKGAHHGTGNRK